MSFRRKPESSLHNEWQTFWTPVFTGVTTFYESFMADLCDKMNIVLVGYRCSGKTTVGKILASELERDFLDTDIMIEQKEGCSIETITSRDGWDHFRVLEKDMIKEISENDNLVIATGGGVVMDQENVKNLKSNGFVVWLKGDAEVIKERMSKDQNSGKLRPSLTGVDPLDEINGLLHVRNPLYQQAGTISVDTAQLSIREVADYIMNALKERLHE
jgi:shikimate kinase